MSIKTCPIMEAIAKKLFGIEAITDKTIKARMINNAVKAGKNAAEVVYGGFDMMKLYRENEQLKGQNAMLCREYNAIRKDSMSIERVQEMAFELADRACVGLYNENDISEFIKDWRQDNDS